MEQNVQYQNENKSKDFIGTNLNNQEWNYDKSIKTRIRGLLERLDAKIANILDYLKKFLKSPPGKVILLCGLLGLLIIPILFMVLGFDNLIIRSKLKGTVKSVEGEFIKGAEVILQGKSVFTDDHGMFDIDDLDYGRWEIIIKVNGFNEYRENIILQRFFNTKNFELEPLDFGIGTGRLIVNQLILDQANLFINDQELSIREDGTFKTGRLIVGEYTLKFKSPYYKDFEIKLNIKSGIQTIDSIILEDTGDLIGQVIDFSTGAEVNDAYIEVTDEGFELEKQEKGFKIKDIPVGTKIKIKITKDGFKDLNVEHEMLSGENSLDKIALVRVGKIISYKSGNIQVSDLDGENPIYLTYGLVGCKIISKSNHKVYSKCLDSVYESDIYTGRHILLYSGLGPLDNFVINKGLIKILNNNTRLVFYTAENEQVLYETTGEKIISWLNSGSEIYFSTESSVYKVDFAGQNSTKITDGVFYLQDINNSSNQLIAINYASSANVESNLWRISTNGEKARISVFPERFVQVKYFDDNYLVYTKIIDGKKGLYTRTLNTGTESRLVEHVDDFIINHEFEIITSDLGSEVFISNVSAYTVEFKF